MAEGEQTVRVARVRQFPGVIGTFMGRDALSLAASYLKLGIRDTVLLPAYTCQEVLKSFARKVNVVFYDLQPDLTIDPDEIRARLKGSRVRMILITDYFGFLQPYRRDIRDICDNNGISLIEDCAHSLLTEGSGDVGHLAMYSFRKILPVPDGGGLRVNEPGKAPVPEFYPRMYSDALSLTAIAKSRLNIHTEMLSRARVASHTTKAISAVATDERILPLSYFAQNGMANLSFPDIIKRRREDFQFWREVSLGHSSLVPVFSDLPSAVCPLGFPVKVKDRVLLESRAKHAGIRLSVHWRLETAMAPDCSASHELSKQMLTLPLYPDVRREEREVLAGIVTSDWRRCA